MISSAKLAILLSVLSTVESNNDPRAFNYAEGAHGVLQIRLPVVRDVNRLCLQSYVLGDAYDPKLAYEIAEHYLRIWCAVSNEYSFESAARIWNGGPDGWWKLSTLPYWHKVKAEMRRRGLEVGMSLLDRHDTMVSWQLQPTSPSPAVLSAFILVTTAGSSSHSDLVMSFHSALNASAETGHPSVSFNFTIKPSVSKPAPPPASPPPTSAPAPTPSGAVVFEFHWTDTR